MFAFTISRLVSQSVVFAAEPSTITWLVILIGAAAVLKYGFLRPRRAPAVSAACRKRRWFPWRAVVLVLLGVAAYRHFNGHGPHFRWDWDLDDVPQLHALDGGFPAIQDKDLWALRRARGERPDKRDQDDLGRDVSSDEGKTTVKLISAPQAEPQPTKRSNEPAARAPLPPHVARTVAEARELAHRAVRQAKAIYDKTGDDAALRALAALKFVGGDNGNAAKAAEIPAAEVAVTPVASAAPEEPAAAEPADSKPAAENTAAAADVAAATTPVAPEAPAAPVAPHSSATAIAPAPPAIPAIPTPPAVMKSPPKLMARIAPTATPEKQPTMPLQRERPAWLDQPGGREGDVYYETVMVERYTTPADAEDALARELVERTKAYVDRYLGEGSSKLFVVPPAFIHDHLVKDRYQEAVESSVGPMVNAYARLGFDGRTRARLQRMHRDAQTENNLLSVAGGAAGVLLILGAVFGYLKLDTLSRGYYTRRLQFAAAAVILTVLFVGARYVRSVAGPHLVEGTASWASQPPTATGELR
jgi:hypothetical protein